MILSCIKSEFLNGLRPITVHPPPSLLPLFPKLRAVKYACPDSFLLPLFSWWSGPSLTELEICRIKGDLASQTVFDFVSNIGTLYPNISTFAFNTFVDKDTPHAMIQALSETLRNWKHLVHVHLNIHDLDIAAYEHLVRLESLTSLTLGLRLVDHCLPRLRQAALPKKPFPALMDLTIVDRGYHLPSVVEWLKFHHLSPSSLTCTLEYSFGDPQEITDLYRTIAAQFCQQSLETIVLEDYDHATSVPVNSIRPLFSFSHLRCVNIARFCAPSLSDDDLLDLATSWPSLQTLYLTYYIEPEAPMPTFKGFFRLLQHCPGLQALAIVIDTRGSEWIDIARPVVRSHLLDDLGLGNSALDDPKRVASILRAVFPSLEEVNTNWWRNYPLDCLPDCETQWALWGEVNSHIDELRKYPDSDGGCARAVLQSTA